MKKFHSIFSLLFLLFLTSISHAQWVPTNGPYSSAIFSLTANGSYIFAGTWYGVFFTTNNGQNWTQTSLSNQTALSLTANGSYIFAGTWNGVFLTSNNGQNWTQTSLNNKSVHSLCVSGSNVFAGTAVFGVYLSTDYGITWTSTSLGTFSITSLASKGSYVFAGLDWGGVYLTTNNGQNWTQTSLNSQNCVYSLAANSSTVFAGTSSNGVYISTNNGQNWVQTLTCYYVYSLAAGSSNIFAGTGRNGVYFSANNGLNWVQRNEGLYIDSTYSLLLTSNYIFAGLGNIGLVYRRPLSDFLPSAPVLYFPPNGSAGQPLSLNLIWYKNPFASSYRVQLSTDSTFNTNLIVNDSTLTTNDTIRAVSGLSYATKYYWHVNAKNANGTGSYSPTWNFTTLVQGPAVLTLKVIPGGFFNPLTGGLRMIDTIKVILVDSATGNKLDSAIDVINSVTFTSHPIFLNIMTGQYYIYVFHRNHLAICSRLRQNVIRGSAVSYDFTTDSAKAYGFNMIKVSASPVVWGMIPGDANQDGYVDGLDQTVWIIQNGHSGYYSADFNGDSQVDALDQALWVLYNGIGTYLPCHIFPMLPGYLIPSFTK